MLPARLVRPTIASREPSSLLQSDGSAVERRRRRPPRPARAGRRASRCSSMTYVAMASRSSRRGLGGDPGLGLLAGPAAVADHPLDLHLGGDVDHDHRVEGVGPTRLGEQRDVVDDQRRRAGAAASSSAYRSKISGCVIPSRRPARGLVGEDDRAQRRPVEVALRRSAAPRRTPRPPGPAPACPRATTSRASASPSISTAPSSTRTAPTVLLPEAMPPVRPTRTA